MDMPTPVYLYIDESDLACGDGRHGEDARHLRERCQVDHHCLLARKHKHRLELNLVQE
jgi:hypothetical protein